MKRKEENVEKPNICMADFLFKNKNKILSVAFKAQTYKIPSWKMKIFLDVTISNFTSSLSSTCCYLLKWTNS